MKFLNYQPFACVSNIKGNPLSYQQHKVCLCYHNIAKIFSILKVARGYERVKKSTASKKRKFIVRGNGKWWCTEKGRIFFLLDATRITTGQFTGGFSIVKLWKIIALTSKNSKIVFFLKKKRKENLWRNFCRLRKGTGKKRRKIFSFFFTHDKKKLIFLSVLEDKSFKNFSSVMCDCCN